MRCALGILERGRNLGACGWAVKRGASETQRRQAPKREMRYEEAPAVAQKPANRTKREIDPGKRDSHACEHDECAQRGEGQVEAV